MRETVAVFTMYGTGAVRLTEVRLPAPSLELLKTKLLLGVKEHEYLLPVAWFDEVNRTYPFVNANVYYESISVKSPIPGFRVVKFTTR